MRTIECPNCGAPATNHKNCEYCGSLLVRFADKGLNLTANNYIKSRYVLPGLLNHLQKNLELQEQLEQNHATVSAGTDIYKDDDRYTSGKYTICFVTAGSCLAFGIDNLFPALPELEESISLATLFTFNIYRDSSIDPQAAEEYNRFKELPSYPLFSSHVSSETDEYGNEYACYQFAIDFGQDAEGAAMLISEIANKVYGCALDKGLEYYTDDMHGLNKIREAINGTNTSTSVADNASVINFKEKLQKIKKSFLNWHG